MSGYEDWLTEKVLYLETNEYSFEEAEETQRLVPNYQKAADVSAVIQPTVVEDLLCYIAFLEICIDRFERGEVA